VSPFPWWSLLSSLMPAHPLYLLRTFVCMFPVGQVHRFLRTRSRFFVPVRRQPVAVSLSGLSVPALFVFPSPKSNREWAGIFPSSSDSTTPPLLHFLKSTQPTRRTNVSLPTTTIEKYDAAIATSYVLGSSLYFPTFISRKPSRDQFFGDQ
jgi:hypothetical protein